MDSVIHVNCPYNYREDTLIVYTQDVILLVLIHRIAFVYGYETDVIVDNHCVVNQVPEDIGDTVVIEGNYAAVGDLGANNNNNMEVALQMNGEALAVAV